MVFWNDQVSAFELTKSILYLSPSERQCLEKGQLKAIDRSMMSLLHPPEPQNQRHFSFLRRLVLSPRKVEKHVCVFFKAPGKKLTNTINNSFFLRKTKKKLWVKLTLGLFLQLQTPKTRSTTHKRCFKVLP